MRIVVAGASGMLGRPLLQALRAEGHEIVQLVRRPAGSPDEVRWAPAKGELNPAVFAGASVVINLAGAGVGDRRWSAAYRETIRSSRVDTTGTIASALAELPGSARPDAWLNASAVGFYGDRGDEVLTEESAAGEGFLADVCQVWEAAVAPAEDAGVRVLRLRTGLVLDAHGGLLKQLLVPFRLGVGGPLAGGRQWLPWISLTDWVEAARFLVARSDLSGPVNLVGPAPVRNADFSKALASAVHRPSLLPVPRFALQLAVGDLASEAVASQRAMPGVLTAAGFAFTHPDVASALRAALAEPAAR
jgi:uncharacterized protein (TIGR01777 family)